MTHPLTLGLLLLLLGSLPAPAEILSLRILRMDSPTVEGLPVTITAEARNTSGRSIVVGYGDWQAGYPDEHGLCFFARARPVGGGETSVCQPPGYVMHTGMGKVDLAPDWRRQVQVPVCIDAPGEYVVEFVAMALGPFVGGPHPVPFEAWTGEVVSLPATLVVAEPQSVDGDAFAYFRTSLRKSVETLEAQRPLGDRLVRYGGNEYRLRWPGYLPESVDQCELLSRFPTSSYAAYLVWTRSQAHGIAMPEAVLASNELTSSRVTTISVPCEAAEPCPDRARTGLTIRAGEHALTWREKWLNTVLRAHPDIFFADELRLRLAVDRFLAHAPEVGRAELEALAKGGRADVAAKAAELLQLVREKGLVK